MKKIGLIFVFIMFGWFAPALVFASTLYFSPSSGSFGTGSTFTVTLRTNTQGQAVNSAEARVVYSQDTLELVKVSAGGTFSLQTPGSPSKSGGEAFFSGGVPSPGYNGSGGVVGVMTFRAKNQGTGTLSLSSGQVLLNDGQGTDSLSGGASASFNISAQAPVTALSGQVEVVSVSHSKQDEWYANKNIDLSWNRPNGAYGFSFMLDSLATSEPDSILDTTKTTVKLYPNTSDGIYFFHIKAKPQSGQFGPVTNYKIQIDTVPPKSFNLTLNEANLSYVSSSPSLSFETTDELSGVASYDVYLDGQVVKEAAVSPYKFIKISEGPHTIKIVAKDKAGNFTKAELPIVVVVPSQANKASWGTYISKDLLILILVVLNVLLILILIVFLWYHFRPKKVSDPLLKLQTEVDQSLEKLKAHIRKELISYGRKNGQNAYEIKKSIEQNIDQAESGIAKKLSKLGRKKIKN